MARPSGLLLVERRGDGDVFCVRLRHSHMEEPDILAFTDEILAMISEQSCSKMVISLGPGDLNCLYSVFLAKLAGQQSTDRRVIDLARGHVAGVHDQRPAAVVALVDLVISVDTSMAHLAPTLRCPTWIMLPRTPDYRWLLNRDDSPWYPAARRCRQDASREYAGVIERVRAELSAAIDIWKVARPEPRDAQAG